MRKFKSSVWLGLILVLLCSVILTGCESEAEKKQKEDLAIQQATEKYEGMYNSLVGDLSAKYDSKYDIHDSKALDDAYSIALAFEYDGSASKDKNHEETIEERADKKAKSDVRAAHPDLGVLLNYAKALAMRDTDHYKPMTRTNAELYKMALDEINKIPKDYNGQFAEWIIKDRQRIQADYDKAVNLMNAAQAESRAEKADKQLKGTLKMPYEE